MTTIQFETGQEVEFDGTPTPEDVDFVAQQMGILPSIEKPSKSFPKKIGEFVADLTGIPGTVKGFAEAGKVAKGLITGKEYAPQITPKRFAGSAATLGLNIATLGGAGAGGALAARLGKTAALGAGFGGAGALQRDAKVSDIIKSAAVGAGLGAGVSAVGAGLGSVARRLTVQSPRQLVNYALRTPSKKAGQGTAEAFLKRKLGGKSLESIEKITSQEIDEVGGKIQGALLKSNKTVEPIKLLMDSKNAFNNRTGGKLTTDALKERLTRFAPDHAYLFEKPQLKLSEVNTLRRALDNNLKEATFLGKELTNEQKAIKMFTDSLRSVTQKGSNTQLLFKQQSEAIRIRDLAREAIKKFETQGRPGFLDIAGAGVGGLVGGVPGAIGGVAVERSLRSPRLQGAAAQGLRSLQVLEPILKKLSPAERMIILNLTSRLSNQ